MGLKIQGDALNAAFLRFKELADKKVEVTEADLEVIVAEELGTEVAHRYVLTEIELRGGTTGKPSARIVVEDGGQRFEATGGGGGMIDAAIDAIATVTGVRARLRDFVVSSVSGGADALGAVTVTVETEDGRKIAGRGVATDVVEASARAYLNAVNKLLRLRERGGEARETTVGP